MKKVKLGELADVIVSGVDKKTKDSETPVKLCNFVNVYYNWAVTSEMYDSFMDASARDAEIDKFSLSKGQVAITKDSETRFDIGIPTYIADDFEGVLLGYHCALITPNQEVLNGKYLNALLHSDYAKEYFANNATGSGQRYTISEDTIKAFPVPLIPIEEQVKIGNYLSDIDRKISCNKKQNDLLEKLAKQLYDYWFVQFDFPDENGRPYKSSGGAMVYNEKLKREIPEGWVVDSLYKIATFVNGLACQKFRPKEGEGSLPVIKIREMHDGITPDTEIVSCNIPDKYKIYNGDILFSWSASLEVMMWANGNGGLNQHIFKVTEKDGFSKHFVYFKLLDYVNIFRIMAEARKTTMGHITTDHLSQSKVELPHDLSIINKFEDTVAPIFEKIIQNTIEINSFKKQVSTLLPLLMTGQATLK